MATPKGMTTPELNDALHAHFIRPDDQISQGGAGAVYLTEVTAPNSNRRADAVHIGLWASRGGGRIDVCELKTSRADFRRELDNPAKAEAWWPYSNAFWIVAPSTDIVPPEELPKGWGLMTPGGRGRRFKVVVAAEERAVKVTVPLLVTLLKCTETVRTNALRDQERVLRRQFHDQEQQVRRQRGAYSPEDQRRLELLDRLEESIGMKLADFPWGDRITPQGAGEGLRALMEGQAAVDRLNDGARATLRDLTRIAAGLQREIEDLGKALKSRR